MNVPLSGLAPLVFLAIVHVAARGAVFVIALVVAPLHPSGAARRVRDMRSSPGDHPVLPVPMVAAALIVVMPGRQCNECRTVPIMVMAIQRTDMPDSAGVRIAPGSMAVAIVVERAVPDPTACENDHGRQQRQH